MAISFRRRATKLESRVSRSPAPYDSRDERRHGVDAAEGLTLRPSVSFVHESLPLCQDSCRVSDAARQVMILRILGSVYIQEEGPVGAVENPEGFPSGSLESRSDFKGPVEDLIGQ